MDSPPRSESPPISDMAVSDRRTILCERFRTHLCRSFEQGRNCQFGFKCNFAHSEAEKRTLAMNVKDGLFTQEDIDAFKMKLIHVAIPPNHVRSNSGMPSPHGLTDHSVTGAHTLTDRATPHSHTHNTTYTVDTNLSGTSPAGGSSLNNISSRSHSEAGDTSSLCTPGMPSASANVLFGQPAANPNQPTRSRRKNKHNKAGEDAFLASQSAMAKSFVSTGSRVGLPGSQMLLPLGMSPFGPPQFIGSADSSINKAIHSQSCSPRTLIGINQEYATPRNQMGGSLTHRRFQSQASVTSGTSSVAPTSYTPLGHMRNFSSSITVGGIRLGGTMEPSASLPGFNSGGQKQGGKSNGADRISVMHSRQSTMDSCLEEHLGINLMRSTLSATTPAFEPAGVQALNSSRSHRTGSEGTTRYRPNTSQGMYYDPYNTSLTQAEDGKQSLFQLSVPTSSTPLVMRVGGIIHPQLGSSMSSQPSLATPGREQFSRAMQMLASTSAPSSPLGELNTTTPPDFSASVSSQRLKDSLTNRSASPTARFRRDPYDKNHIRLVSQSMGSLSEVV
eukprot:GILI01003551.1.p1 GENE.GILI01003551.1~~GILI01003551.1.p1  ORF type:complete len:560 (-),score=81.01 GILI01003551.1:783-2462(-)